MSHQNILSSTYFVRGTSHTSYKQIKKNKFEHQNIQKDDVI